MTSALTKHEQFNPDRKSNLALYDLLTTGLVPEFLIRWGIRAMLSQKLKELRIDDPVLELARTIQFVAELKQQPIAIATNLANKQHYEVPAEFFKNVLGPSMKYSCCLWTNSIDLASAELAMLKLTAERAGIADGQRILDLGCGWGSFSLFAAKRFKNVAITAVSNSQSQRAFIEEKVRHLGLNNVQVITCDINDFDIEQKFDRVVSVEMFEHAKNYERLLEKTASWLTDDGKLFVHIFSHTRHQYHFDNTDSEDWLSRYFFSGGTMPSQQLLLYFQKDLHIVNQWCLNGKHYQQTAEAWLQNMQHNRRAVMQIIEQTYGMEQAKRWWIYWRLFFLACAELWGFDSGKQWTVSHYLFEKG